MTVYKDESPCTESNGGCCVSYDVIELIPDEVKHFGVAKILIGIDGCQFLVSQ